MSALSSLTAQESQNLKLDYLNLLVTQLRHQNPLEPMDNAEMTSQLAQIAQLEQLEKANTSFDSILSAARSGYATGLIGRTVLFEGEDGSVPDDGRVTGVEWIGSDLFLGLQGADGKDKALALDAVKAVTA